jgi:hypothetical protein
MIRRVLHAEISDVRALARDAKRRAVREFHRNLFVDIRREAGCILVGRTTGFLDRSERFGIGYVVNDPAPDLWPDHARLLTIGRVTLAAWGGRSS